MPQAEAENLKLKQKTLLSFLKKKEVKGMKVGDVGHWWEEPHGS